MTDAAALRRDTVSGLKWSFASQAFVQVLNLALTVVLARLLTPGDFGVVGMVTVLSGFGYTLRDLGLGSAIIQAKELEEEALSTVFWATVCVGLALCLVFAASAGPIATFYELPVLRLLTVWLSLDFLLSSFTTVQESLLRRRLEFRRLLVVDVVSQLLSGAAAIAAAAAGLGAWSLVIRALSLSVARTPLLWFGSGWRPAFVYRPRSVARFLQFSLPLLATTSLNYWTRNIDKLLIGRALGDVALGLYTRAYAVMLHPQQNISQVVSRVMFPAYSRMEGDKAKVKRTYLRMTRTVAAVTFPLLFGVLAVCEPFVLTVLGGQWGGVVPVLRILAVLGACQSVVTMNGDIFLSQGATPTLLRVGGAARLVLIAFIVSGLPWGVEGVAAGYTLGALLLLLPVQHYVGRLIDLSVKEWLANLSRVLLSAVLMAAGVAALDLAWVRAGLAPYTRLGLAVSTGAALYAAALAAFDPGVLRDMRQALRGSPGAPAGG